MPQIRSGTVTVTNEDIEKGCRFKARDCPHALAITRLLIETYFPDGYVEDSKLLNYVNVVVDGKKARFCVNKDDGGTSIVKVYYQRVDLPEEITRWISNFDNVTRDVQPISYTIQWTEYDGD